ncbi:Na/Pi cotransporter family protein [Sinisalibacter lacisalsi]|uniref:Na/Pi cotransporter II-like protein n=1 Tax=Sinisalibacter lacisalsi TaxID=1526570 RepID=A0ABQ1QUF0_9RHOB|nr:Na/Pi cotransporter family protein [Sinisalibacter lacisalsi]GGD45511.1 Na/Pi cotransporter II-like protein [Sinisalibacter lacisalsi]
MRDIFANFELWTGLLGGLALFLFGMDLLTRALKRVTGDRMRALLARLTENRLKGVLLGAGVTAVVQSSSVTTVLLVGFISAGVMTMAQSVAVIMGANIGTTVTAQILAFKITTLALPMVTLGVAAMLIAKDRVWQEYGQAVIGLGLVFYGMAVMSDAMSPLAQYPGFLSAMASLDAPVLALLVGAGFTALVQSSSATTGILIVLAGQGLLSLEAAIGAALGANIGTCITALLAATGKPREAVRAALVHTLFNVAGVLAWVWFIPQLALVASAIAPAGDSARGLAWAHTIFNVVNMLVLIGFTAPFARLVEWLVPDRPDVVDAEGSPKFLDRALLDTPAIALDAAAREIARLGYRVAGMVESVLPVAIEGPRVKLDALAATDKPVDRLHAAIVDYLGAVSLRRLSPEQSSRLVRLISVANDIEQIADMVARDVVISSQKRLDDRVLVSTATRRVIARFHAEVAAALHGAIEAFETGDAERARQVRGMKGTMRAMGREIALHGIERLTAEAPRRVQTYTREVELVEILDDIFRLTRRIAREVAEAEGANGTLPASEPPPG